MLEMSIFFTYSHPCHRCHVQMGKVFFCPMNYTFSYAVFLAAPSNEKKNQNKNKTTLQEKTKMRFTWKRIRIYAIVCERLFRCFVFDSLLCCCICKCCLLPLGRRIIGNPKCEFPFVLCKSTRQRWNRTNNAIISRPITTKGEKNSK